MPRDQQDKNRGHAIIEFTTHKEAKDASRLMNGVEVAPGQHLKVNILTDGPTISANNREFGAQNDDLNDHYINSAQARSQLMQKLMGDKDVGNLRPQEPKPVEKQEVSLI